MTENISFTILHKHGLDNYGLTQIYFESEGFYYYYRCKLGSCSLEKFATQGDADNLENGLDRTELEPTLVSGKGFLDVYPESHFIVIGKLLGQLSK